jgi:hypothetical protein
MSSDWYLDISNGYIVSLEQDKRHSETPIFEELRNIHNARNDWKDLRRRIKVRIRRNRERRRNY